MSDEKQPVSSSNAEPGQEDRFEQQQAAQPSGQPQGSPAQPGQPQFGQQPQPGSQPYGQPQQPYGQPQPGQQFYGQPQPGNGQMPNAQQAPGFSYASNQMPNQPYGQPQPGYSQTPPIYYQPAPLEKLTGGMKFGWFAVSFLVGIAGIILAWLVNVDKAPQVKSDAMKWSIVGAVANIVFSLLYMTVVFGGIMGVATSTLGSSGFTW